MRKRTYVMAVEQSMRESDQRFVKWASARIKQIKQTVALDKEMPGPWDHMLDLLQEHRDFLLSRSR